MISLIDLNVARTLRNPVQYVVSTLLDTAYQVFFRHYKYKTLNSVLGNQKKAKDYTYHKEKMLLCKQAEKVEKVDSNVIPDSPGMCNNDIQTDQNVIEYDDERVTLANLIANLKLDVDENKKIQKQLKKANA
nr:hypothetical protein [Tanacetum cinerariifolium]